MSPSMSLEALRARALLYQNFREFFKSRSVVEVETPVLANDNAIIRGQPSELGNAYELPLPAMQDLVDSGSGAIYQIYKQFRADIVDRRHRSEFSVLQWSQLDWSDAGILLDLTAALHAIFSGEFEPEQRTFQQAFIQRLGFDPDALSIDELRQQAQRLGLRDSLGDDRQAWLKLMFIHFIEPTLGTDIPLYLTALPPTWRLERDDSRQPTAYSHTDIYIDGIKVGSVLQSVSEGQSSKNSSVQAQLNIVFGLDRLLMIVLETRQIEKVMTRV
jgi:lysyl-tRNA synthetase class 2